MQQDQDSPWSVTLETIKAALERERTAAIPSPKHTLELIDRLIALIETDESVKSLLVSRFNHLDEVLDKLCCRIKHL